MDTFSVYDAIVHLKHLQTKNIKTDDKWEYIKNIITCRFVHFHPSLYNYHNIGLIAHFIHEKYCIFELWHKNFYRIPRPSSEDVRYIFVVFKSNDNMFIIAGKKEGKIKFTKRKEFKKSFENINNINFVNQILNKHTFEQQYR